MTGPFVIEPPGDAHDRRDFTCGVEPRDRYFHQQVTQDIRRRVTNCFVAVDTAGQVAVYYTLAASSLPVPELPEQETRRLPRYPSLPAGLIGRLAVAERNARQGLGAAFILDAIRRASRASRRHAAALKYPRPIASASRRRS